MPRYSVKDVPYPRNIEVYQGDKQLGFVQWVDSDTGEGEQMLIDPLSDKEREYMTSIGAEKRGSVWWDVREEYNTPFTRLLSGLTVKTVEVK